jgi:hypothetical protein
MQLLLLLKYAWLLNKKDNKNDKNNINKDNGECVHIVTNMKATKSKGFMKDTNQSHDKGRPNFSPNHGT